MSAAGSGRDAGPPSPLPGRPHSLIIIIVRQEGQLTFTGRWGVPIVNWARQLEQVYFFGAGGDGSSTGGWYCGSAAC